MDLYLTPMPSSCGAKIWVATDYLRFFGTVLEMPNYASSLNSHAKNNTFGMHILLTKHECAFLVPNAATILRS